jgi:hypothetical protein
MVIRTGNRMGNRTAIRTGVDAIFSYRTENRIPIRFAANRTGIRTGNPIRVDGPLCRHGWHNRKREQVSIVVHQCRIPLRQTVKKSLWVPK